MTESSADRLLFSNKSLAQRLEAAEALGVLEYTRTQSVVDPDSGAAWVEVGDGYAMYNGPASPVGRAIGIAMEKEVIADDLEAVESFYSLKGGVSKITLCPHSHPSLSEILNARGYEVGMFLNVLYREIATSESFSARSEVTVHEASPADEIAWMDVISKGFADGRDVPGDPYSIPRPMFHAESNRLFIARINGEDAGGAAMSIRDGVTYFFSTSVLPQFRNRGAQAALLAARLKVARGAGCDLAAVNTVPGSGSQRNVERFGFRVAYTKLVMTRRLTSVG